MYPAVKRLMGVGDVVPAVLQKITDSLFLIPGDVALSGYEDTLAGQWPSSMGDCNRGWSYRLSCGVRTGCGK
ncbi:MAG: hypothetical protein LBU06_09825 [Desulfovibrio sp.]|jgi:hypothetical protein|nr:hypothetical protein [Desulfovibrio sp.]